MKNLFLNLFFVLPILLMTSCSSDDTGTISTPSRTYVLGSLDLPGISGTAKFIRNDDNSTTVELQLNGTSAGGDHPAHIHFNTAAEGGGIAITLGTVDGATGFSTTTFSALDDATPISYTDLLSYDGYINVHSSDVNLGVIIAQGDIGQNELNGQFVSYNLDEVDVAGVSGTILFFERVNGEALAIIELANTQSGDVHPAHIHMNDALTGGPIIFTFNSVQGLTGKSSTNISELDDTTPFGYFDVLSLDAHVNVHLSAVDLGTLMAQGNVGNNILQ